MKLSEEIGKRLQAAREATGMTQREVAERMNMRQQSYSRYETGVFELNYEQMIFLCKLFDVSADYLLGLKIY